MVKIESLVNLEVELFVPFIELVLEEIAPMMSFLFDNVLMELIFVSWELCV